jgi:osmotically-inducible protein OsmY
MTDIDLREHVQKALDWEPSIDASDIGVSAEQGVITLRGHVKTYAEKATAERVALRVFGVKAVADDLEVRLASTQQRTDTDIAQAVVSALRWNTIVPDEHITAAVTNGWVTLKGHVEWEYQRVAATNAIRYLAGVRGVTNDITVQPRVKVPDVQAKIEAALKRSAEIDARRINVAVADGTVTLTGHVHSWFERNEARRAAWSAPGVRDVQDHIAIAP